MAPPPQVLITGATGHVGAAVLVHALQEGYAVRAAVRNPESEAKILQAPWFQQNDVGERLTFARVPDIGAAGAYTAAIRDVQYVIHVASPMPAPHLEGTALHRTIVAPAIRGTLNLLEAARASPTVKRVVITSSVSATKHVAHPEADDGPDTRHRIEAVTDQGTAYLASKKAALLASDVFLAEHEPHFDLVNIMPSYTTGRTQLAAAPADVMATTNRILFGVCLGDPVPAAARPIGAVHIDDVARLHVDALTLPDRGNRSFGATLPVDPNDVFPILQRRFPAAIAAGIFHAPPARQPFYNPRWDTSATEAAFGLTFKGLEEQVVAVAQQYLELKGFK